MNPNAFCVLAARLMRHPVAAYHEHSVRQEVELICERQQLNYRRDRYGDLEISPAAELNCPPASTDARYRCQGRTGGGP
jgi:hypothetical protein